MQELSWRYRTYEPDEAEPGSDGRVLRNRLKITDPEAIEAVEEMLLEKACEELLTSAWGLRILPRRVTMNRWRPFS